jgi:transcriptional regulator with XRE-family HTH domain
MELGSALRDLRKKAGLTQQELAKRLAISNNYLCLLEKGKRTPSITLLEALANELNVPVSQVVWGAAEIPSNLSTQERRLYKKLTEISIALFAVAKQLERIGRSKSE